MSKKNFILLIVLAALIAVAYVYQGPWQSWQEKKNQPKNFFAQLDMGQVNKIEITDKGKITTLNLNGNRWKIAGTKDFYVSDATASNMVARLKELAAAQLEIASENKAKKAEFNTDEANGVLVKLKKNDKELASLMVGKITNDYTGTYISSPNSDITYLTKIDLYSIFIGNSWYDKTIFASDKTKINKIRFQVSGQEFVVVKSGEDWLATGTKAAKLNKDKVNSVADVMASLIATEIPDQKFDGTGLDKSQIILEATGDGIDNVLMIGKDNGQGLFYAKRGDSDNIYLITKAQKDQLNKQLKDLK